MQKAPCMVFPSRMGHRLFLFPQKGINIRNEVNTNLRSVHIFFPELEKHIPNFILRLLPSPLVLETHTLLWHSFLDSNKECPWNLQHRNIKISSCLNNLVMFQILSLSSRHRHQQPEQPTPKPLDMLISQPSPTPSFF